MSRPLEDAEIRALGYEPTANGWRPLTADVERRLDEADQRRVGATGVRVPDGSIQEILDRILAWHVVDQDGATPITGDRADIIRFTKATTFVASTELIQSQEQRVLWFGWLQYVSQECKKAEDVAKAMHDAWHVNGGWR